jgi:hypothetical protein
MAITKPLTYDHDWYNMNSSYGDIGTRIAGVKNMLNDPTCDPNAVIQQVMILFSQLADLVEQVYTEIFTIVEINQ